MSDAMRAYITVAGGAIAILIALTSSLASPVFLFDKVVVGALLVGGLAAFGVSINIGQSAEARQARSMRASWESMKAATASPPRVVGRATSPGWEETINRDAIEKKMAADASMEQAETYSKGGPVRTEPVTPPKAQPDY